MKLFKRRTSRASRIIVKPSPPSNSRKGIAIVAIAKNEEDYILDWLSFHALAGASEIILYNNQSDDETASIAERFTGCPVTVIPWEYRAKTLRHNMILPRQIMAYAHAICTFGHRFEKMA